MKKKLLALLLCLALVVTAAAALAACENGNDEKGDNPSYGAYVLSDKGTYLSFKKNTEGDRISNLTLLYEQDDALKNTYSMIAVDGDAAAFAGTDVVINEAGADAFIKWMSMPSTRNAIADFGKADYDEALFYLIDGAKTYNGAADALKYTGTGDRIISISTTTSVNDTGLLGYLEGIFEEATGWDIEVSSAGTGAAIEAAKKGNADLLLVHSASQERTFIDGGYAREVAGLDGEAADAAYPARISFMYNYFVLIGPASDPAGVKNAANISEAFKAIAAGGYNFVSRGDASGTHTAEVNLWKTTGLKLVSRDIAGGKTSEAPEGSWYISAGQGMGACLTMANESLTKAA